MPQTTNKNETYRAWAEITLKLFQEKMLLLDVFDSGEGYNSLEHHVRINAGGDAARIDFIYNYYLRFQDIGVNKYGEIAQKEWYSKVFFREVNRLKEIMAGKYGEEAAKSIVNTFRGIKEFKVNG